MTITLTHFFLFLLLSSQTLEPRVEKLFKVNDQNDYGEPNSGPSNINDISSKINGYDNGTIPELPKCPMLWVKKFEFKKVFLCGNESICKEKFRLPLGET